MFLVVAILISSRNTLLSFTDQTDVYQWTGKLKLSDMSAISHARQVLCFLELIKFNHNVFSSGFQLVGQVVTSFSGIGQLTRIT